MTQGMEETFYQSFPGVEQGATTAVLAARGLAPKTAYRLRARAGNRAGEGPWSAPVTLCTLSDLAEPMASPYAALRARLLPSPPPLGGVEPCAARATFHALP